ncbi:MAG: hypothetical protein Q8J63_03835 [Candidatus Aquicultor sp.]|nr:hypothetical protein [Candidatus Aquicultor sp.]
MAYRVELRKGAQGDFATLDGSLQALAFKALNKLKESPSYGEWLGSKHGIDLTGCHKLYFNKKRHRIVYRVSESRRLIEVIAIGERDGETVYLEAAERLVEIIRKETLSTDP